MGGGRPPGAPLTSRRRPVSCAGPRRSPVTGAGGRAAAGRRPAGRRPAPPARAVSTPGTETAETSFAITTITAQDVNNNTVTGFTGTVDLTETGGGTEMHPALKHVLEIAAKHSKGRDKNLILITDAQIGNEAAILELMKGAADFPVRRSAGW